MTTDNEVKKAVITIIDPKTNDKADDFGENLFKEEDSNQRVRMIQR